MKYIFSKDRYIERRGKYNYEKNKQWVDECEGKEVQFNDGPNTGECGRWSINIEWCEVIGDNIEILRDLLDAKEEIIEHQRILLQQDKKEIDLLNEQIQELRHIIRNIKQSKAYIDGL